MGVQAIRHAATGRYVTDPGDYAQQVEALLRNEISQWVTTGRDRHTGAMMPTEMHIHSPARFGTLRFAAGEGE
jgi:hypothetical protein